MTVEDPIEYQIPGINQVQVNTKIELTFARALRAFLRQNPDIIMVGEIRDKETAEIAINASLTGHLVLSTLHTNDAAGANTRLIDMGVEPFLVASSLLGVIAQRLMRKVCTKCRVPHTPTDFEMNELGLTKLPPDAKIFTRDGLPELFSERILGPNRHSRAADRSTTRSEASSSRTRTPGTIKKAGDRSRHDHASRRRRQKSPARSHDRGRAHESHPLRGLTELMAPIFDYKAYTPRRKASKRHRRSRDQQSRARRSSRSRASWSPR